MITKQITLPFRRRPAAPRSNANRDLIGCAYQQDMYATVTVVDVCPEDVGRVLVQRDIDQKTWTMPGWLMLLILLEERKRAA